MKQKEVEKYLEFHSAFNPFNVITGYISTAIDQEKTPVSVDEIFLTVIQLAFEQLLSSLPEDVRMEVIRNLQQLDGPDKEEYLAFVLAQAFFLWPLILQGIITRLPEIVTDHEVANLPKLYENLNQYVVLFEASIDDLLKEE